MKKVVSILWLAGAIILSLGGAAGFIILFAPGMNVFWIILSPIIIAVYQIPAVVVYSLWKKRYKKNTETPSSQN
jgi:hypothetical protein